MKKILIINSPLYNYVDTRSLQPLGISYLAANLRKNGYECNILDANNRIPSLSIEEIMEIIQFGKYDLIGISSTTINFPNAVKIARSVKESIGIPVFLGGVHAIFKHHEIIEEYECFDAIMCGEGEFMFVDLCDDYFSNGKFTYAIPGVTYKELNGNKHIATETILISEKELNELPFPIRDDLEKYSKTKINGKEYVNVAISSSRGCPYQCLFCSVTNFRSKWIMRSAENVAEEIYQIFCKYNDIFIVFTDDNFYVNEKRAIEIINKVYEKCKKKIPFLFATRCNQLVKAGIENLKFFKEMGCYSIELGVENGCDEVLKRMKKDSTAEINARAIKMLQEVGIYGAIDYIMFDPWTTMSELDENIRFMKDTGIFGYFEPIMYVRMKPYPGTLLDKMNIDMDHYFVNKEIEVIYSAIKLFRVQYQMLISELVNLLLSMLDGVDVQLKLDLIWLKTIPYVIFDKVVYNRIKSIDEYYRLLMELKVEEKLDKLCVKYNFRNN